MDFIVRILFTGLIAFIPNADGTELDVLLLNVGHDYHVSDGTTLDHHKPLLLARAGACTGQCATNDAAIAQFLYPDKSASVALDSLAAAVTGGGAWQLSGSELSVRKGSASAAELPALVLRTGVRGSVDGILKPIPTTPAEREDFSWLADLKQVCTGPGCTLDASVLDAQPPAGLVAARLRLRSGTVFTYAIAKLGGNATPVHFERLDGTGSPAPYSQAIANWIGADIAVSGTDVEIVEEKFDGSTGRSMKLRPDTNGRIEVAVLNLPPFVPPVAPATAPADPGRHFEMYYELGQEPPAREARLVPKPGAAPGSVSYPAVTWQSVHPSSALWSDLLNDLRMNIGRSVFEQALCPPVTP